MLIICGGKFRKQQLHTPKGQETRPTSSRLRETVFNICQQEVQGSHFLDLCAGSGAMGLEALSRGAAQATFVDSHQSAIACIRKNLAKLELEGEVLQMDALVALKRFAEAKRHFSLIYIDPPYGKSPEALYALLSAVDAYDLLRPGGTLFAETSHSSVPELNGLCLFKQRKTGRSQLWQFHRKQNP